MQSIPLSRVRIADGFWAPRRRTNREVTLPLEYRLCQSTGRLDVWKLTWRPGRPNPPHVFWDSDIAKWIEAAAYSLATHPDKALERRVDTVVARMAQAQGRDGYLNSHFSLVEPGKRWTNLRAQHELYCAGHLMEAAAAYAGATGKKRFLDVICCYADHIGSVFGRQTEYPWQGKVRIAVEPELPLVFGLALRVPGWCRQAALKLNGRRIDPGRIMRKGYLIIRRRWRKGDTVDLTLPMPVERLEAHPAVGEDCGRVALQRGPLVYCLEETDNGPDLNDLALPRRARLTARVDDSLLKGMVVITGTALRRVRRRWNGKLYQPAGTPVKPVKIRAVPYFCWNNRGEGEMRVWIREDPRGRA